VTYVLLVGRRRRTAGVRVGWLAIAPDGVGGALPTRDRAAGAHDSAHKMAPARTGSK